MLVFFHCHKVAGTSIVRAAEASGMKLPEGHRNGNPVDAEGTRITWSDLPDDAVFERFETFRRDSVDMVAFEFDSPFWSVLERIDGLRLFTVLREPNARSFSNFRMDVLNGDLRKARFVYGYNTYQNFTGLFRATNYYTRFFSRCPLTEEVTRDHLNFALSRLNTFDSVCVLETGSLPAHLGRLGFAPETLGQFNASTAERVRTYADQPHPHFDVETFPAEPEFFVRNAYDCALYSWCLSRDRPAA